MAFFRDLDRRFIYIPGTVLGIKPKLGGVGGGEGIRSRDMTEPF